MEEAELRPALKIKAANGESPTWSAEEQALYWIDIKDPSLHRFDPRTGEDRRWPMPEEIGAFALCRGGGAVIAALRSGLARFNLETGEFKPLAEPPYDPNTHRFNDGKCDARGRFWVATMDEPPLGANRSGTPTAGPVCSLDKAGRLAAAPGLSAVIGNGLAFSPDRQWLYFTHTTLATVFRYPFDLDSGELGERETFVHFEQGKPDGAAFDAEGFYWCALWGAGKVVRAAPDGRIDRELSLPASQPSMCTFGGEDLGTLYVTTARYGLDTSALSREPLAGSLFHCRPGVTGLPAEMFG